MLFCETIFATSVPQNIAIRSETQVLRCFTCRRFANCSETLPNIILAQMEENACFFAKPFSQLLYPEILQSGPKHNICSVLRDEGLRIAPKHSQTSFWL